MENPSYVLKQENSRIIIPEMLKLLVLVTVLYLALYLNLFLLDYQVSKMFHLVIISVLLILIAIEIMFKLKKAQTYYFYKDRVVQGNKTLNLSNANLEIKKNFFDKLLHTETIQLSPEFKLEKIKESNNFYSYLANMIKYTKGNYNGHQRIL
tara:strand:+ start:117 stop:572 length:456 start_codon:yes stop_codon:yes gene_type:complete